MLRFISHKVNLKKEKILFRKTSDFQDGPLTVLCYGPSGYGKTTLAATLPRPLIINAENGLRSISDKDIDVYDLTKQVIDGKEVERPRQDRFEAMFQFLTKEFPKHKEKFDWIVFDSLTEVAQNLVEFQKKKFPDKKDALNVWGEYSDNMIAFLKSMRDFHDCNIMFLALDKVDQDESGRRFVGIDMPGKKVSSKAPADIDIVMYLNKIEDGDGKEKRVLVTGAYKGIIGKDRTKKLKLFEEPDMRILLEKINGKKK